MASDASFNGHDDSRQSDLAVMDSNEYKNKRRLERILDALDNIPDQADRAREQYNAGEIDMHARRIAVQDAVQDAVWEAWNLLVDHDHNRMEAARDAMAEYIDEEYDGDEELNLDEITVEMLESNWKRTGVWPRSRYFFGHPEEDPLGRIEQVRQDAIVVNGLRDFYHLDEVWREQWTERSKPRNGPPQTVERERVYTVPRDLSWAAALRLKEFLNREHDMEIQFEAMDDRRPYDDWREEFEKGVYRSPEDVDLPHKDV